MMSRVYFGPHQSPGKQTAENFLKAALDKLDTTTWAYNLLRYIKGELKSEQLLAKADNNKFTEAHAYIGMNRSAQGTSAMLFHT
jgi:hypothetical protein